MREKRTLRFTVAYDGTQYHGFAKQPGYKTIQGTLEEALYFSTKEEITVVYSGRTDTGVHARSHHCIIETTSPIPVGRFARVINANLPGDISISNVAVAEEGFHPRFLIKEKIYRYQILNATERDPFLDRYAYFYPHKVDFEKMQEAAKYIEGTHDFACFCSAGATTKTSTRTVYYLKLTKENDMITVEISGSGFLYNMVRIIVGTLLHVGIGKKQPEDVADVILSRDRLQAGPTAPAKGLIMYDTKY